MKFWKIASTAAALVLSISANAAIIQYEVSGSMELTDTNWNEITTHELTGNMYISDVNTDSGDGVNFAVESFTFYAGGYEWSGTGVIGCVTDRCLHLDGPGDWEMSVGTVGSNVWGWEYDTRFMLPEYMYWGGDAWQLGEDLHSRVALLELNAVPIPAAVWLFGSGLIGLVGFARRKKA